MIKTIIVDDEKQAREGMLNLLKIDSDIEITDVCKNGLEAIDAIYANIPDLLFLDIQMPGINGFEVLNSIEFQILPKTIFVTAYDQYALKAFEVHAIDYLLKPFSDKRFYAALKNAKTHILNSNRNNDSIKLMLRSIIEEVLNSNSGILLAGSATRERLIIKKSGKIILLDIENIIRIEAENYYIKIYNNSSKFHLVRESLSNILERLPKNEFVRIHRSHVINVNWIEEIEILGHSEFGIRLKNHEYLYSGRTYKDTFKKFLKK